MRPLVQWSGAVLVVLFAGVGYDAARTRPANSLAQAVTSATPQRRPPASLGGPVLAAVLLQAADCAGNLRIVHLLNRAGVRDGVQLAVIWFVGPASDSLVIRRLLPAFTAHVPLRQAPPTALAELRRLGHTSSPLLLVLDQEGRVRFASQSPRSSREFAGLRRIIEGLTWFEEH